MRSCFALIILLLFVVGCNSEYAQLSAIHKTRIKVTVSLPSAVTADKIMLWGQNANGNQFARVVQADSEETFIFDNGAMTLYAIAWTGVGMTGDVYCSTAPNSLNGPDINLNLNLTNSNCGASHFKGGTAPTIPETLSSVNVEFCESVSNLGSYSDACTDDLANISRKAARGHAMSYRYVLKTFDKTKNNYSFRSDSITSSCLQGTPFALSSVSGLAFGSASQIPFGDGSTTPFYFALETFPGSVWCDDSTHGKKSLTFENGLKKTSSTSKYFTNSVDHKLFVKMSGDEICNSTTNAQTYAGGNGQQNSPYLICNPTQFYNMHLNKTSSFKLMNDIDLKPYYYGVTTLPNIPNALTCLKKGSNFLPLGYDTGTCTYGGEAFASGDFDGGGKTIKNLNINMPNSDMIGLYIRKYGGEVRRVRFENVQVKGRHYTSLIAGISSTSFRDIVVDTARIESTGSLVGGITATTTIHPNNCVLRNILMKKIYIQADSSVVGGMVGDATSCEFYDSTYSGNVVGGSGDVGGIAGKLFNGSMNGVAFEGYVKGYTYVGGIAGSHFESAVNGVHAIGGVYGAHTGSGIYSGGLFGSIIGGHSATSYLTNSYFFGDMVHFCTAGTPSDCGVGNITGDSGSWGAGDFATAYYANINNVSAYSALNAGTLRIYTHFFNPATSWPANFTLTGDFPRLNHEVNALTTDLRHPCQTELLAYGTVADQIAAGKGTQDNPISICKFSQLLDMQANVSNSSKNYKLLGPIVTETALPPANGDFAGTLDGDFHGMYKVRMTAGFGGNLGWWNSIASTGTMKNLYFFNSKMNDSGSALTTSLIAKTNSGTIDKVYALLTQITSTNASGQHSTFVHTNEGTISNSYISGSGTIKSNVAGIAFANNGTIEDSISNSYFSCTAGIPCENVSGITLTNAGTIRRHEITSSVVDISGGLNPSNFSFLTVRNTGTIEDIHITADSRLLSRAYGIHAVARENESPGVIRRVYNQGTVRVANGALPATGNPALLGDIDFQDGASSTVGYSISGIVEKILYPVPAVWTYPSQHGSVTRTPSGGDACQFTVLPAVDGFWETAMSDPVYFTRFGLLTVESDVGYTLKVPANFTGANDVFLLKDPAPCSQTVGNPVSYMIPYTYNSDAGKITSAEKFLWATFSNWSVAEDITSDTAYHTQRYNYIQGNTTSKPVWIFDTTNSMRLNR